MKQLAFMIVPKILHESTLFGTPLSIMFVKDNYTKSMQKALSDEHIFIGR